MTYFQNLLRAAALGAAAFLMLAPASPARAQRGSGVGRALLAELLRLASAHGFHSVIARIAGHNEVSIGLHKAAGFELVGVEREVGRKHRQWLDVVELQRLL